MKPSARIGVIGTGFIGSGLVRAIQDRSDMHVTAILTRRDVATCDLPDHQVITNNVQQLIQNSDVIVECSGDVIYGTDVIAEAIENNIPVVTMNTELQVTTGSYFARRGYITEAEGDQPGCLAALHENAIAMGFTPLVYGNIKGFLNKDPKEKEMKYWSKRNGISLEMVTSFTDGTKVQYEQALVANGLGAGIVQQGLLGYESDDVKEGGDRLALESERMGKPISDYLLAPKAPPGVFLTATHHENQKGALRYFKMGEGPYYTLVQPFHLCHLEIMKTIRRVLDGREVLLNNSERPTASVAAIAKRDLQPGQTIAKGIGSFEVRGEAITIDQHADHVPIGLLSNATLVRPIKAGQVLTMADVELPQSLAKKAWDETMMLRAKGAYKLHA